MKVFLATLAAITLVSGHAAVLRVGTKPSPPFSFVPGNDDPPPPAETDPYGGFSMDLLAELLFETARDEGLAYTSFNITNFPNNSRLIDAVRWGEVDFGIASTTITPEREQLVDFTLSFFDSGFRILVRNEVDQWQAVSSLLGTIGGVVVGFAGAMIVLIASGGVILFVLEDAMPGERPVFRMGSFKTGILDAAMFTATVLFRGQSRAPKGILSSVVAALCGGLSVIIIALTTALATVALASLDSPTAISSFEDLSGRSVVVVKGSTAHTYMRSSAPSTTLIGASSVDDMFDRFKDGEGDAVVYDFPILQYFANNENRDLGTELYKVVGPVFQRQQYGGIAAKDDSDIREPFSRAIITYWGSDEYDEIYDRWFSPAADVTAVDSVNEQITTIAILAAIAVGFALLIYAIVFLLRAAGILESDDGIGRTLTRRSAARQQLELLAEEKEQAIILRDSDIMWQILEWVFDSRHDELVREQRRAHRIVAGSGSVGFHGGGGLFGAKDE